LLGGLEKGFRIFNGDHRFKESSFAVAASEVTVVSGHANRCKSVFLIWEIIVMVRNSVWNGEGEFVPKMGLPDAKSLGLQIG
jgi:hypothetical protein